jgi:hypothetical protein
MIFKYKLQYATPEPVNLPLFSRNNQAFLIDISILAQSHAASPAAKLAIAIATIAFCSEERDYDPNPGHRRRYQG